MEITLISPPDRFTGKIEVQWQQLSQETIEALIAELYRADRITFQQAQQLLNVRSWQETAAILERHGAQLYYDKDDFEADLKTLRRHTGTKMI